MFSVGGGIEITVLCSVAFEDDTRRLGCGQFVWHSGYARNLLVSGAQLPPQGSGPLHFIFSLLVIHSEHFPKPRLHRRLCRTLATPVQPVLKILNLDDMRDFGIPDLHGDGGKSFSDVANPLVTADRGESLGNRFVETLSRHVERMRSAVQIIDNYGASFERHPDNLPYSLFVRPPVTF